MNTWFKQFVESFGECECRKITEKQFQCFARNMHEQYFDSKYGIRYGLETENLRIRAEKFSVPYVFTEQIERLIDAGGNDDVIDLLEKYEGLCDEKRQKAMGWIN